MISPGSIFSGAKKVGGGLSSIAGAASGFMKSASSAVSGAAKSILGSSKNDSSYDMGLAGKAARDNTKSNKTSNNNTNSTSKENSTKPNISQTSSFGELVTIATAIVTDLSNFLKSKINLLGRNVEIERIRNKEDTIEGNGSSTSDFSERMSFKKKSKSFSLMRMAKDNSSILKTILKLVGIFGAVKFINMSPEERKQLGENIGNFFNDLGGFWNVVKGIGITVAGLYIGRKLWKIGAFAVGAVGFLGRTAKKVFSPLTKLSGKSWGGLINLIERRLGPIIAKRLGVALAAAGIGLAVAVPTGGIAAIAALLLDLGMAAWTVWDIASLAVEYLGSSSPDVSSSSTQIAASNAMSNSLSFTGQGVGNLPQRNNNPGALEYRDWQKEFGATKGSDGRFAQFPTAEAGFAAQHKLLSGKKSNIREVMKSYAPSSENDLNSYLKMLQSQGVDIDKRYADLDPSSQKNVRESIARVEGFYAGKKSVGNNNSIASAIANNPTVNAVADTTTDVAKSALDELIDAIYKISTFDTVYKPDGRISDIHTKSLERQTAEMVGRNSKNSIQETSQVISPEQQTRNDLFGGSSITLLNPNYDVDASTVVSSYVNFFMG